MAFAGSPVLPHRSEFFAVLLEAFSGGTHGAAEKGLEHGRDCFVARLNRQVLGKPFGWAILPAIGSWHRFRPPVADGRCAIVGAP